MFGHLGEGHLFSHAIPLTFIRLAVDLLLEQQRVVQLVQLAWISLTVRAAC
jgi:hypothetical protein